MLLAALAGVIVLAALVGLGLAMWRTWQTVKVFGREMAAAGERVAAASDGLNAAMGEQAHRSEWPADLG
jgi:hypothetical protein